MDTKRGINRTAQIYVFFYILEGSNPITPTITSGGYFGYTIRLITFPLVLERLSDKVSKSKP